jgi:hypothetical protein
MKVDCYISEGCGSDARLRFDALSPRQSNVRYVRVLKFSNTLEEEQNK